MSLFRYLRGSVRLSVAGDFAERFYNLLIQEGLRPYDLTRMADGSMVLTLPMRQFGKIRRARRTTGVRVCILSKNGLPRLLWRYRKRWGVLVGAVLCALVIFLMSGFVWSIRFEGEVKDEAALLAALKQAGLHEGSWRSGVDSEAVELQMLSSDLGLSFVSVVFKGSVAQVQIVYAAPKPEIQSTAPCNLVAAKDGVITYMMVEEGVPMVQKGDAVRAGELLVSGIFDSETVGIRKVHAAGRIYARTTQTLRVEMPYETTVTQRTGQHRKNFTLRIFNFSINLYFGAGIPYAIYDKIDTTADAHIGAFILPVSLITHTYYEKEPLTIAVTSEQAQTAAEQMLELQEQQEFFGSEYVCTGKSVIHENGRCVAMGEYVRECDIALAVPIE